MGIPYSLGSSNNYKVTSCMKWLYTLEIDFLVFMRLLHRRVKYHTPSLKKPSITVINFFKFIQNNILIHISSPLK